MTENHCTHGPEHTERIEVTKITEPYLCTVCRNEAKIGIRLQERLGRIALCDDCLTIIGILAKSHSSALAE